MSSQSNLMHAITEVWTRRPRLEVCRHSLRLGNSITPAQLINRDFASKHKPRVEEPSAVSGASGHKRRENRPSR